MLGSTKLQAGCCCLVNLTPAAAFLSSEPHWSCPGCQISVYNVSHPGPWGCGVRGHAPPPSPHIVVSKTCFKYQWLHNQLAGSRRYIRSHFSAPTSKPIWMALSCKKCCNQKLRESWAGETQEGRWGGATKTETETGHRERSRAPRANLTRKMVLQTEKIP